ncbi:hypothetical protein GNI_103360 [Gregarina niphandrodes]|uniref:Uncharacterized protein n=1 Tax=Gregarina niphandrodes TaxID=110365 RepID=A0A023B4B3_GRENI|nr:hypothetical protein GNI_103360 [Gregarina niphandrodes]EZG56505.1 hypothetical protein GNI_103360 [Gregarina niphandrodes]|eukprot:XP_011131244.1 hypothetical protein GNI_103360 [Gregarina niphandrodes]
MRRANKSVKLLSGWPRQCFNKILDDEIFGANVDRISQVAEDLFNVKDPIGNTFSKATVGVLARALTLTVIVPYQRLTEGSSRKEASTRALYRGFQRQCFKECVFTASYVISSDYFAKSLLKYRPALRASVHQVYQYGLFRSLSASLCSCSLPAALAAVQGNKPGADGKSAGKTSGTAGKTSGTAGKTSGTAGKTSGTACKTSGTAGKASGTAGKASGAAGKTCGTAGKTAGKDASKTGTLPVEEKNVDRTTNVLLAAAKAAAAGALSTVVTAPIEYYGRPANRAVSTTCRKAARKSCYNAVNTTINKSLQAGMYHRVLFAKLNQMA